MYSEVARRREVGWLIGATLLASLSTFAACGSDPAVDAEDEDAGPRTVPTSTASSSGTSSGSTSSGSSGTTLDAGKEAGPGAPIPTEPNLKVAFIGDTASGSDFKSVLQLIKDEGAQAVMIQGDLTYLPNIFAVSWFSAIDNVINKDQPGSSATVTIPYFVARGNHDFDWNTIGSGLKSRMATWSVTPEHNDPTKINYAIDFKGLKVVMVAPDETNNPSRQQYVEERLEGDAHIWKICSWHKNQRASNVGPKSDEMGWGIYESCRNQGAIIAQGHSHTYSRSKTLTNDQTQAVDPTCSDPYDVCVGPGRNFFFDSSLGGVDTRSLDSVASAPYWAQTYTGSFGALFITFNVGGDPNKAQGYFKTVGGVLVDPPPASGKTTFTITRSP
jgi:predicted phosphodiesterase